MTGDGVLTLADYASRYLKPAHDRLAAEVRARDPVVYREVALENAVRLEAVALGGREALDVLRRWARHGVSRQAAELIKDRFSRLMAI